MQIGILLLKDHRLLSVAALLDVFETANRFYTEDGLEKPFDISLLYLPGHSAPPYENHIPQPVDGTTGYDLLLVPSFKHDAIGQSLPANAPWVPWLQNQHKEGAAIASFCTGAFVLGAAGLLNNRPATTHINAGAAFTLRVFKSGEPNTDSVTKVKVS